LDIILIFKVGILRRRKATVVLFTSCRGEGGGQVTHTRATGTSRRKASEAGNPGWPR
jgi:hypothetical protein